MDDCGLLSEKVTCKGYDNKGLNINYNDFVNLSRGGVITNKMKKPWIKKLDGIRIPHRKHGCDRCDNKKTCKKYVDEPSLNCFECEKLKACKSRYSMIMDQKKTRVQLIL